MRVYKVLRKDARGKRWSLLTGSKEGDYFLGDAVNMKIQYYVTKPSVPRPKALKLGYGITVFNNIDNVFEYISGLFLEQMEIWECSVNKKDILKLNPKCSISFEKNILKILQLKLAKHDCLSSLFEFSDHWPKGTMMVKKLQLKRKIKGEGNSISSIVKHWKPIASVFTGQINE